LFPHSPPSKVTTDAALAIARDAGERLLADLSRAELLTDRWKNQELGLLLVETGMNRCLTKLAETGWVGRENQLISSEFWRVAGNRLKCGMLQLRAREKPRGYAGDFETLQLFYDKSTCDDPLGKLFDRYFQRQTAVEAVRARIDLVAARIVDAVVDRPKEGNFQIASIGSGPAIEIEIAVRSLPENYRDAIRIQLFDFDPDALEHAAIRLGALLPGSRIATHRENLYRLTESASAANALEDSDFLFCTGLFDYLADDAAVRLLKFLYDKLTPGGRLTVGNFALHNPSRSYMEWIGNWYLIYRDPDDLTRLAALAGLSREQFRIDGERTGVDLFLVVDRN
jgi:extracellular factor (EF) 3-hydroxypalmitic acid methyl ester biosynthesis protein